MANFAGMFSGEEGEVDYDRPDPVKHAKLPMPLEGDSLEVLTRKLTALAQVVENGKSVAVRTGYSGAAPTYRDPEKLAIETLTEVERRQYKAWVEGSGMPVFDWEKNKEPVKGGDMARKRYERRALAMNKIWKVDCAVAENAMWACKRLSYMIPLITAMTKLETAATEVVGGIGSLSALDLAEVQTCRKAINISTSTMNAVMQCMHQLTSSLNSSMKILQAREHALEKKILAHKPKQDLNSQEREHDLQRPAGGHVDHRPATRGLRGERTDLNGGISNVPTLSGSNVPTPNKRAAPAQEELAPCVSGSRQKRARKTAPMEDEDEF